MITIKDIEMPTKCAECKFFIGLKSNDYSLYGQCIVHCETVNILNGTLPPSCPLDEIRREGRKRGK